MLLALSIAVPQTRAQGTSGGTTGKEPRCLYQRTDNGQQICISQPNFNADLCAVIETFANRSAIPSAYFARLIWRESLFRPQAVSPKGAEGIAQFIPSTARQQGLVNSFDVIDALDKSAGYLAKLKGQFGNLGLAAAAYNAGEARLRQFLTGANLPIETRDYVFAITGNPVETWRDHPPTIAAPPLDDSKPFGEACTALAETRRLKEPVLASTADWAPWGVQLAAHYNALIADRLFTLAISRLPEPLNAERALIVRQRGGNFGHRARYAARIGRDTRMAAEKLCGAVRAAGTACTVLRNR